MISVADKPDHRAAVAHLVGHYGWRRGAELGVGGGHLSRRLLEAFPDLQLVGVDTLNRPHRARRVRAIGTDFDPRYTLLAMNTADAADEVEDGWLDFIFIDAGHSYEAVRTDIERWQGKVRAGGAILGHDYGHPKYPGVARAAHEYFGDRVELLGHTIWAVQC